MAQRETQRSLRTGPLGREVSQQESFREAPRPYPQAEPMRQAGPVMQEHNSLMDLAQGLKGLSGGLDTFFQLQATYGKINMEEAKIRGALGLPKGHGLGLEWGVDKGFNEGKGISIGTKISTEIAQRLQEEDYGIPNGVTAENYQAYVDKVTNEVTQKYLGDKPDGDILNGAADNIAKAKVAGEVDGYRRHWVERQNQQAQEVTGAVDTILDSSVQSIQSLINQRAAPDPVTYRENISRSIKALSEKMKLPRNQLNALLLNALETKLENLSEFAGSSTDPEAAMKAMGLSGYLIKIMQSPDRSGFSFTKALVADKDGNMKAPFKGMFKDIVNKHHATVAQMNKNIEDRQKAVEERLLGDVIFRITTKQTTEAEGYKEILGAINNGVVRRENAPDFLKKISDFINSDRVGVLDTQLSLRLTAMAERGQLSLDNILQLDQQGALPSKELKQLLKTSMNTQEQMSRAVTSAVTAESARARREQAQLDEKSQKEREKMFADTGAAQAKVLFNGSKLLPAKVEEFKNIYIKMSRDPKFAYADMAQLSLLSDPESLTAPNIEAMVKQETIPVYLGSLYLDSIRRKGKSLSRINVTLPAGLGAGEPDEPPVGP